MKGFIVLYKIKDEDAEKFQALLEQKMSSESDPVEMYSGGDDYEINRSAFMNDL
jgi:hypothetical protein